MIIDYDALYKNTLFFRRLVGDKKLFAVVKNNAYGHGLVHVASMIKQLVDGFAVGDISDAEKLIFTNKDILILLPQSYMNTEMAVKRDFILDADSFETLDRIDNAAKKLGKKARIHIKIDSGMSRLGFRYEELARLIERLQNAAVCVDGIFSHFYGDTTEQCDEQLAYFERCLSILKEIYPDAICHIANTSATLLSAKYHLDGVRVGLGLYGYGSEQLTPVKRVYASIISVRRVTRGSAVGYGAKYCPIKDTTVAVLNVGYAEGLPRISIGKRIKIGNSFFPIVAVCMAMTIVDVGDATVHLNQRAVLLGDGVDISDDKLIIYELLCNLR